MGPLLVIQWPAIFQESQDHPLFREPRVKFGQRNHGAIRFPLRVSPSPNPAFSSTAARGAPSKVLDTSQAEVVTVTRGRATFGLNGQLLAQRGSGLQDHSKDPWGKPLTISHVKHEESLPRSP
jgi:hypothetical protein